MAYGKSKKYGRGQKMSGNPRSMGSAPKTPGMSGHNFGTTAHETGKFGSSSLSNKHTGGKSSGQIYPSKKSKSY